MGTGAGRPRNASPKVKSNVKNCAFGNILFIFLKLFRIRIII